jgi:asparagine synthase (glutamine-hydrolysing)
MLTIFPSCLVAKDTELLKQETRQLALKSVRETCQGFLDDGFEPLHVPDAFYIFDRVRRWAGTNARKVSPICDLFTPFCTIPYIETALAMPLSDRIAGRFHQELIRATTPALLDFPYDKPSRQPLPKLGAKRVIAQTVREAAPIWLLRMLRHGASRLRQNKPREGKRLVQPEWVEAKRETILNVCLDQKSSMLWNYVDRRSFENIMSPKTTKEVRAQHCARILSIATLFYYEAER